MATTNRNKLNELYTQLRSGRPVTSAELADMGVSKHLAVHYARAGWLRRLARGVYSRPHDKLELYPSLIALESMHPGLHVGGKSALDWQGVRQYVNQESLLHLYGHQSAKLPAWFTSVFPATYRRKQLFEEPENELLHVQRLNGEHTPLVSAPERAWLELLSEVGVRQPLGEARELAESVHTLRVRVLQQLLVRCVSVKTVRLCLQLGRETQAPWAAKLDASSLPTGSDKPWVARTRDGLLVLPPSTDTKPCPADL